MFKEIFAKLNTFEDHHQAFFAILVALGIICFSWGVEKILERYIFPHQPSYDFIVAILIGLLLLYTAKHVILKVM